MSTISLLRLLLWIDGLLETWALASLTAETMTWSTLLAKISEDSESCGGDSGFQALDNSIHGCVHIEVDAKHSKKLLAFPANRYGSGLEQDAL